MISNSYIGYGCIINKSALTQLKYGWALLNFVELQSTINLSTAICSPIIPMSSVGCDSCNPIPFCGHPKNYLIV